MHNKTIIIRFSFCDIQNNQSLNLAQTLITHDITKTSSNDNYLIIVVNNQVGGHENLNVITKEKMLVYDSEQIILCVGDNEEKS